MGNSSFSQMGLSLLEGPSMVFELIEGARFEVCLDFQVDEMDTQSHSLRPKRFQNSRRSFRRFLWG